MSGKIPRSFIDDLIERTDIISLIDAYVPLRKKGGNHWACCPFHQEKTASFSVSPQKQIYYCFGCGAGGNVISFLMNYDHLSFVEALEHLAKAAGLELPQENKTYKPATTLYDVMSKAAAFYQAQLKKSPQAITYLKSRGITGKLAKEYELGFAPQAWDNLISHFEKDEKTQNDLLQTGLILKKEKVYDRFRSRIIFPIRDTQGRVIGFGGRVLTKEEPKYLNSPETVLFHKGRELYGLYEARQVLREIKHWIVVEGYMDVLALAQYEIRNVVGTLGTATTADHLNKLLRYTQNIVFCFDGDQAGREAAWRALQVALPFIDDKVRIRFLFLPQEDDPDSFIRKKGKNIFLAEVEKATSFSDFLFKHISENLDLTTLEGKASLSHTAALLLERMPESALKQMVYKNLSYVVSLDENRLRALSKEKKPDVFHQVQNQKQQSRPFKLEMTPLRQAIMMLLQNPRLCSVLSEKFFIEEWDFSESMILKEIINLYHTGSQMTSAMLLEYWRERQEHSLISALLMKEMFVSSEEKRESEFLQIMQSLERQHQENKIEKILTKGKVQGLTEEEKKQLQEMIAAVKAVIV